MIVVVVVVVVDPLKAVLVIFALAGDLFLEHRC
jgi:hypothetical protein